MKDGIDRAATDDLDETQNDVRSHQQTLEINRSSFGLVMHYIALAQAALKREPQDDE